jgi:putative MATE family efflux protein
MEKEQSRAQINTALNEKKLALQNPLGSAPIGRLMLKFAIPAISGSLATAAYNITNQILIGQRIGYIGNAATSIAFPLMTLCAALAFLFGIGGASNFNLNLGAGKKDFAAQIVGTSIFLTSACGIVLAITAFIFAEPLMRAFGATEQILPYAVTYTRIIACGIPFVLFSSSCSNLIRSDGSPGYSLLCTVSGALLNILLGIIFIFVLDMGIAGAACATVISQFVTFILTLLYLRRFKSVKLTVSLIRPKADSMKAIARLGVPGFLNQFMMMFVQITLNNILRNYGAMSVYGSDIPIAVVGVISQLNMLVVAFTVGIALGCQPIFGFNYGAKIYARVKEAYKRAAVAIIIISTVIFVCFQVFPRQIVSIFSSNDSALYFQFAVRYMRIFMVMVCLQGLQPLTATFFTSIGKAFKGLFITIMRQGIFMLPLFLILPRYLGIDGIVYAGPIADSAAILSAVIFAAIEFRIMTKHEVLEAANQLQS